MFFTLMSPPSWKRTSIRLPTLSLTIEETQNPTGLSERFQSRGDVHTIAIDVVVFNDDIAEIDADFGAR